MLTDTEKQKIINHFGESFYQRMCSVLEKYASAWRLEQVALIDYFSVNCLFTCHSKIYGDSVLKICRSSDEIVTEIRTLQEYDGSAFCKVFAFSAEDGAVLEEVILPGTQLRAVSSTEERLKIFLALYTKLHIVPKVAEEYPTYGQWVERITQFMEARDDQRELCGYMKKARDVYWHVHEKYNQEMLLHGDFHHDNILLGTEGRYQIIDPKGVVDDPIFDIPRFLLNECRDDWTSDENERHIARVIHWIGAETGLPAEDIRKVFFVEMAMANCWCVESNEEPNMAEVKMAYQMLNQ